MRAVRPRDPRGRDRDTRGLGRFETAGTGRGRRAAGPDVGGATIAVSLDGFGAMGGAMGVAGMGAPMHHGGHHVNAYHHGQMAHAPLGAPGHQFAHGMYGAPHHPGALYPLGPDGLAHLPPGAGLPPHAVLGVVPRVPAARSAGSGACARALHRRACHAYLRTTTTTTWATYRCHRPRCTTRTPPRTCTAPTFRRRLRRAPRLAARPAARGRGRPDAPPPGHHDDEAYDGVVPLDSYGEGAQQR